MDDIELTKLHYALSAMFTECVDRHHRICHSIGIGDPHGVMEDVRARQRVELSDCVGDFVIIPPSIGLGEGTEAHPTASSSEAPRRI